jgi:hypothetical protein
MVSGRAFLRHFYEFQRYVLRRRGRRIDGTELGHAGLEEYTQPRIINMAKQQA